jgi:DNA/RNA endonuclease YhcR with UshA esterase domain
MKKICILTALGILLPSAIFAQSCSWVCDNGSGGTAPDYTKQLRLSEFLPNPVGDDTAGEFIEIENLTKKAIDFTGWQIADASGRTFTFKTGKISAHGFFAVTRVDSKISLNNTGGETVTLLSPDKKIQDDVEFEGAAPEGASYARSKDDWVWTMKSTPGKANSIVVPNEPPELQTEIPENIFAHQDAKFSAAKSSDPDGDILSANWVFSDGQTLHGLDVTKTFETSGEYSVEVTVFDSKEGKATQGFDFSVMPFDLSDAVLINELYPKPNTGEDEFIELVNSSDRVVELGGWQMTDGTRMFTFNNGATIEAQGFLAVYKSETSIALNDTGDSVQLLRPDESVADKAVYTTAQKGKSFSRFADQWSWETPTPNAVNESQESGTVLGATTNAATTISVEPITASKSFFESYGIFVAIVLVVTLAGFGLYRKWKKDRADQDEYDVA